MEWAHRYESQRWRRIHLLLGVTSIVFAAILSAIPNIPTLSENLIKVIVPIGAMAIAILSGLQTFLNPLEISDKFRIKSDEFESLRHYIEEIIEFHCDEQSGEIDKERLENIRERWDKIPALNMSSENFKKAGERIGKLNRYPKDLKF
jgi:hypothetical protein